MNSVQIGSADLAPSRGSSVLSSKPTHTMARRFEVNPANQPSWEVPVFPAAGALKPRDRTPAAVPLRITSCMRLTIRYATLGSSAARRSDSLVYTTRPSLDFADETREGRT